MDADKTILLVLHSKDSNPGRVGKALERKGCRLKPCRPREGEALPRAMDGCAGAVVFGGPMSANDDKTKPFIGRELKWIETVVDLGKPFLGICLGAQLLARALGARVAPHAQGLYEIGYYPIRPTPKGEAIFDGLDHV
ncbi:MAG: gamma-glutamyl-gamma-aminobutyrate hydrolase family protein, partial [Alphaproteobacteria bacterium]